MIQVCIVIATVTVATFSKVTESVCVPDLLLCWSVTSVSMD